MARSSPSAASAEPERSNHVNNGPWWERELPGIFLWLTVASGAVGIYAHLPVLWTLLLVMLTSLFLGLFAFALLTDPFYESEEEAAESRLSAEKGRSAATPE